MREKRAQHLMQLHFEDALSEDGARELLALLDDSEELREEFYESAVVDRLLSRNLGVEGSEVVDSVMVALRGHSDQDEIKAAIMADLKPRLRKSDPPKSKEKRLKADTVSIRAGRKKRRMAEAARKPRPTRTGYMWKLALPCAAAIMACVCTVAVMLWGRKEPVEPRYRATVVEVVGNGVVAEQEKRQAVGIGFSFSPGQLMQTANGCTIRMRYDDGTEITVYPNSLVQLEKGIGKRIHVQTGSLFARVQKQPQHEPMVINSPYAWASVLGTRFTLSVAQSRTLLDVEEGAVELSDKTQNRAMVVRAGYTGEAGPGANTKGIPGDASVDDIEREDLRVVSFSLINADTDEVIPAFDPIPDGAVIDLKRMPTKQFNIRANTEGAVGSIKPMINRKVIREKGDVECRQPFTFFGDTRVCPKAKQVDYKGRTLPGGDSTLKAIPYACKEAKCGKGVSLEVRIRVLK